MSPQQRCQAGSVQEQLNPRANPHLSKGTSLRRYRKLRLRQCHCAQGLNRGKPPRCLSPWHTKRQMVSTIRSWTSLVRSLSSSVDEMRATTYETSSQAPVAIRKRLCTTGLQNCLVDNFRVKTFIGVLACWSSMHHMHRPADVCNRSFSATTPGLHPEGNNGVGSCRSLTLFRHPGLDPGSTFSFKTGRPRIKSNEPRVS